MTLSTCRGCGRALTPVTCPHCGVERDIRVEGGLVERTISDRDQTSSDREQSASDSDQKSSDQDQDAADSDLAAGSDTGTYDRTTRARTDSIDERDSATREREAAGLERARVAGERDRAAAVRDRGAEERDLVSRSHDQALHPLATRDDIVMHAERDRERAATDRARAADDRLQSAADRDVAGVERAEASRMRFASATLLRQAATDQLTGARVRSFGLDDAARELERAQRTGATLVLAFVDVDGLKQLNDSLGHLAGDALLKLVGERLQANLRPYDVILRYGGDEFVCLLSNLELSDSRARFDRIAAELAAVEGGHSITFGLACAIRTDTLQGLIARADADLIAARSRLRSA